MATDKQSTETVPHAIDHGMIETYFDGELRADQLGTLTRDDIVSEPMYGALDEIRRVVRTDYSLSMGDIDGMSLLDAINRDIDAYESGKKSSTPASPRVSSVSPVVSSRRKVVRWIPAMVAAALFCLSLPGLVTMFRAEPAPQMPSPTVVYVNGNPAQQGVAMCAGDGTRYGDSAHNVAGDVMPIPAVQNGASDKNQLTVEEMDFAIRHLIQRIESLEEANRIGVESGKIPFDSNVNGEHSPNL